MHRLPFLVVVLAALILGGAGPALAEPPFRLDGAVTDNAGVLAAGDPERIAEAADRLRAENGTQLFVVYVESFDGAAGLDWADNTAGLSQLGDDDVLLAVAVAERAYAVSVSQGLPIDDDTLNDAFAGTEERLAEDDWAGAAVALADGLRGGGAGIGVGGALAIGGVALAGAAAVGVLAVRRRRASRCPGCWPTSPDRRSCSRASTGSTSSSSGCCSGPARSG